MKINFESSIHADEVGFRRPTAQQRTTSAGKKKQDTDEGLRGTFPAPLVLPGDDLSFDTRCPQQTLLSWVREKERNEVTSERNVVYVVSSPGIESEVDFVHSWGNPQFKGVVGRRKASTKAPDVSSPDIQDVLEYMKAFYHGINVELLSLEQLRFTNWNDADSKSLEANSNTKLPKYIGLATSAETIGIRTRPSKDGVFKGQLNLDDLLDTAISILPDDAYALLMLVEHDLFEDEDDDFCCGKLTFWIESVGFEDCRHVSRAAGRYQPKVVIQHGHLPKGVTLIPKRAGRAYGGSRVAVVSTARYNPSLDDSQDVEREHAWPASHCDLYMRECCGAPSKTKKAKHDITVPHLTPLQAAVSAHAALPTSKSPSQLSSLWLSRVCQTASHELGHCFGIDHCVYYACVMQATASLAEDVRQPPYLCPVDLGKMLRATGADERTRYEALLTFCGQHKYGGAGWFKAFQVWITGRLREMEEGGEGLGKQTAKSSSKSTSQGKTGSKTAPIELSP